MQKRCKVFVAGPFSLASSVDGFDTRVRSRLSFILDTVREGRYSSFSAHERESWGEKTDNPKSLAEVDLRELKDSCCLIAYLGMVPSFGTSIELGIAIATGIPILVLRDTAVVVISDFYKGLQQLGHIVEEPWDTQEQVARTIEGFLSKMRASRRLARRPELVERVRLKAGVGVSAERFGKSSS